MPAVDRARLLRGLAAALLLLPLLATPAPASDGPVTGAERTTLFERFREKQAAVRSFKATVVQKRRSPQLLDEATAEGRILFEKPDRFRWDSGKPDPRIVVADGTKLTVYDPVRKWADRHEQRDQFAVRMGLEFMATGLGGSLADLEKRFRVDAERQGGTVTVTLTPKSKLLLKAVKTITIRQADGDAVPASVVLLGPGGDRTETTLRDVVLNPPVPADAFKLKLPPGIRVYDAKERAESGFDAP